MQKLPAFTFGFAFPMLVLCYCNAQRPAVPSLPSISISSDSLPYDLHQPMLTINLVSEELKEISGLSPTDTPGIYLAIADERGEVFLIDGNGGGSVLRRILFREKGDFESVEMVGQSIWTAKSNGDLFEISDWQKESMRVDSFETPLKKADDVEGLAYDARRHALLLACKVDPAVFEPRPVYAFDLKTKQLGKTPVYSIVPEAVNQLVPYNETEKHDAFSPSGIALHPLTGDVYVISTALKRLVVLDYATGKIKWAQRLDKKILPQPEGISFDQAGNLLLSSEGKSGEGLLMKFEYRCKK